MKKVFLIFVLGLFTVVVKAQSNLPSTKSNTIIIDPIEDQPKFPGGEKAFQEFIIKNLKLPKTSIDAQGKVYVTFIVQKDGSLTNVKVVKGIGQLFDAEALRVIKKSPKWIPAKQNGKPARVQYTMPVNFYLSDQ